MTTCTHNGPVFHYKAYEVMVGATSGPTANLEPFIGTRIYMVSKKHSRKADQWMGQWTQLAYIVI